jgi:hypothetical protein
MLVAATMLIVSLLGPPIPSNPRAEPLEPGEQCASPPRRFAFAHRDAMPDAPGRGKSKRAEGKLENSSRGVLPALVRKRDRPEGEDDGHDERPAEQERGGEDGAVQPPPAALDDGQRRGESERARSGDEPIDDDSQLCQQTTPRGRTFESDSRRAPVESSHRQWPRVSR